MEIETKYLEARKKYALFVDGVFIRYITEVEMGKIEFARKLQESAITLAQVYDDLKNEYSTYFDRGYNAAGEDPITSGNLEGTGIVLANLTDTITLAENLQKFMENDVPVQADYSATLNKIKNDM